ncbi:hypothetical protein N0V90_010691 [Kalmusia sp. IMI 367209]|nr:hypothetical protein N0V90_010691 [Kalmusia sp. IMI 367209]
MRTATILGALSYAATAFAQAVEIGIEPSESAPAGCDRSPKGNFTIGYIPVAQVSRKRATAVEVGFVWQETIRSLELIPYFRMPMAPLYLTLEDGVLTDGWKRTGSVVANHQFQFDGPPQAGAIYTGGFSVCQNDSLALGGTTRWWNCRSGGFFNLYDEWIGAQCEEIRIIASFVDEPTSSSSSAAASSTASSTAESSGSSSNSTTASITSSAESSSSTLSAIPLTSINGTKPSGPVSRVSSASSTATPTGSGTPDAPNSAPSTLSQGATFGAMIGILAAALIL